MAGGNAIFAAMASVAGLNQPTVMCCLAGQVKSGAIAMENVI